MSTQGHTSNHILDYPELPKSLLTNEGLVLEYERTINNVERCLQEIRNGNSDSTSAKQMGRIRGQKQKDITKTCQNLISVIEAQNADLTALISQWRDIPSQVNIEVSIGKLLYVLQNLPSNGDHVGLRKYFRDIYTAAHGDILKLIKQKYDNWIKSCDGTCAVSDAVRKQIILRALDVAQPSTASDFQKLLFDCGPFSSNCNGEAKKVRDVLFDAELGANGIECQHSKWLVLFDEQSKWLRSHWKGLTWVRTVVPSIEQLKLIKFNEGDKSVIRNKRAGSQATAAN